MVYEALKNYDVITSKNIFPYVIVVGCKVKLNNGILKFQNFVNTESVNIIAAIKKNFILRYL